jgi:carbon-monoxide dehydrogenase large subunit
MSHAYGSLPRKEDARFIRGQGTFVDDIALPGMLHGAILRSPLAHARIISVDASAASAHPAVVATFTGADLAERAMAWMPTLFGDVQAVLATDKVRFQGQEIAFVVATDRYAARDALELISVDYEPLPPLMDARAALDPSAPVVRDELPDGNHIFDWEAGDKAATDAVFAAADVVVGCDMIYPRSHPAPLETCGAIADYDAVSGKLTVWSTSQAPHAHRMMYAALTGLPEHKIRIVSPDLGGGFGAKVPVYPGYVCAIAASLALGRPVKWVEDRSENLMSTAFARDYHMHGEIAATADGTIVGLRAKVLADHGAFNAVAQPSKFPAGFFHIFTGSYQARAAYCEVSGVFTNKAPGGVAYSCSFRITEAVYLVERLTDMLARELGMDPARLRMRNLLRPEQFPYTCPTGWQYDSGDYPRALQLALDMANYDELRREQADRRARGEYMGIGLSFFTEGVGAGPRGHMDIMGLGMADGADLRVHPTGKVVLAISVQTQGQGHETTFAQLVAHELGLTPDDVDVVHGDTDKTPFGLGRRQEGPRPGAPGRRGHARSRFRRPGVAGREMAGQGRPRPGPRHRRDRPGGALDAGASRRDRRPPGRVRGLQPAQPHVPLRRLHLRHRRGPRHRRGQGPPVHRGRRLRRADQPDDRRGAGAPGPGRRHRHRLDAGHHVR